MLFSVNPLAIVLALPALYICMWLFNLSYITYRISRSNGVRAPRVSNNPVKSMYPDALTRANGPAIYMAGKAAYKQYQNRMKEHFNEMMSYQDPRRPNIVEMGVGRRRVLVTQDPEHIKTILTGKFSQFGKGEFVHLAASPFLGDSIFTTDGQLWHKSRALIRPMFTKDRIRDIDIFSSCTENLLSKLPSSGQTVDICDLFYRMTLDVSMDFLLGRKVGALDNPNSQFSHAFTDVQRMQVIRVILL